MIEINRISFIKAKTNERKGRKSKAKQHKRACCALNYYYYTQLIKHKRYKMGKNEIYEH